MQGGEARLATAVGKIVATEEELGRHLSRRFEGWAAQMEPLPTAAAVAEAEIDPVGSQVEVLRAELGPKRLRELKTLAMAQGLPDEMIEEVDDHHNPKEAITEILVEAAAARWRQVEDARLAEAARQQQQAEAAALAGAGPAADERRAELQLMRLSQLKKLAAAAGAVAEQIEEVDDDDAPVEAAILLVLELEATSRTSPPEDDQEVVEQRRADLRTELQPQKLSALKKIALAEGLTAAVVEAVDDDEQPKAAVIELIVSARATGGAAACR